MNYGGDAADQIVRYSMEGMEHTLRISGSIAKNLAVLIVAVMKDQKKTRGKTNLLRMLKEQRAMKFFTIPQMTGCGSLQGKPNPGDFCMWSSGIRRTPSFPRSWCLLMMRQR